MYLLPVGGAEAPAAFPQKDRALAFDRKRGPLLQAQRVLKRVFSDL